MGDLETIGMNLVLRMAHGRSLRYVIPPFFWMEDLDTLGIGVVVWAFMVPCSVSFVRYVRTTGTGPDARARTSASS